MWVTDTPAVANCKACNFRDDCGWCIDANTTFSYTYFALYGTGHGSLDGADCSYQKWKKSYIKGGPPACVGIYKKAVHTVFSKAASLYIVTHRIRFYVLQWHSISVHNCTYCIHRVPILDGKNVFLRRVSTRQAEWGASIIFLRVESNFNGRGPQS